MVSRRSSAGRFARRYPEVHVDLVLDDRVLDLVEYGFDLALRIWRAVASNRCSPTGTFPNKA